MGKMSYVQKLTFLFLLLCSPHGIIAEGQEDEQTKTKFLYFLKSDPGRALTFEEIRALPNPPKTLHSYIHGWNAKDLDDAGSLRFKDELFQNAPDCEAVMVVDWTPTVTPASQYPKFRRERTPGVAQEVANELKNVKERLNIPPSQVTMAAHSLGTAVMGQAGRELQRTGVGKVKEMVGLDPPILIPDRKGLRIEIPKEHRLRPRDASKVVGIHTSRTLGTWRDVGDEDYYFFDWNHPALEKCSGFDPACSHRAARELGQDYFAGKLDKSMLSKGSGDSLGGDLLRRRLDDYSRPGNRHLTIFVLDYSPSMLDHGRLDNLIASTQQQLNSFPLNQEVAMVIFGGYGRVIFGPTNVTDPGVRKSLAASVPGGGTISATSIGAGLKTAIGLIPQGGCANIVLTTDGEENASPYASEVEPLIPRCTSVSSLASGPDAAKALEGLSQRHGGKVIPVPDQTGTDTFWEALRDLEQGHLPPFLRTVQYPTKSVTLNSPKGTDFFIDPGMKAAEFRYPSTDKNVEVTVTTPSGEVLYGCREDHIGKSCKAMNPAPGKWNVKATKKTTAVGGRRKREAGEAEEEIIIRVSSTPDITSSGAFPVLLQAGLSNSTVDPQNNQVTTIFASLLKELDPVTGAVVEAVITSPNGDEKKLKLYDDGVGADEFVGDGIYSRFISTELKVGERYGVVVTAECKSGGSCKVREEEDVAVFERQAPAGSIRALSVYKAPPPATVTDLEVIKYDEEDKLVTLRWTAVGANADSDEPAAGMDIRWRVRNGTGDDTELQWQQVNHNFTKTPTLTGIPREVQQLELELPREEETNGNCVYFNVRYYNEENEFGEGSNDVSPCDWKPEADDEVSVWLIILIIGAVLVVAGAIYAFIKKKGYRLIPSS